MIAAIILLAALVIATGSDLKTREIPNLVPVLLLISGAASILFDFASPVSGILGFLFIGLSMLLVGLRFSGLGGGDIKMGACLGFALGLINACYALLIGLFLAAGILVIRKAGGKQSAVIPLAPFLSIGTAAVLFLTNICI